MSTTEQISLLCEIKAIKTKYWDYIFQFSAALEPESFQLVQGSNEKMTSFIRLSRGYLNIKSLY